MQLCRIFLLHFFCLLCLYLPAPLGHGGVFFFCSTRILGFLPLIFVILSIHSHCPIYHFDLGFIFSSTFFLAFLLIPIIPLLPVFISNHRTSNHFNPLNAELNPICQLLVLLGAHPILHVSRIRVNALCIAFSST